MLPFDAENTSRIKFIVSITFSSGIIFLRVPDTWFEIPCNQTRSSNERTKHNGLQQRIEFQTTTKY